MKTLEELSVMTDDELRVICAEFDGWKLTKDKSSVVMKRNGRGGYEREPNYPQSLDACSEFRRHLISATEQSGYARFIWIQLGRKELTKMDCFGYEDLWHLLKATPRHHTIAFILTKQY